MFALLCRSLYSEFEQISVYKLTSSFSSKNSSLCLNSYQHNSMFNLLIFSTRNVKNSLKYGIED